MYAQAILFVLLLALTAFAAYFLYQLGILGMYLFSMPLGKQRFWRGMSAITVRF
jgi:hypothetical protein